MYSWTWYRVLCVCVCVCVEGGLLLMFRKVSLLALREDVLKVLLSRSCIRV